ncbi:MAG: hypothetical protein ACON4K_01850 [Akkermansiaceae bacterium]
MKPEMRPIKKGKGELISISDPFADAEWAYSGRKGRFDALAGHYLNLIYSTSRFAKQFVRTI